MADRGTARAVSGVIGRRTTLRKGVCVVDKKMREE